MRIRPKDGNPGEDSGDCPGDRCFQLLGRRWTAFIIWALLEHPRRFTDLREVIDGVSDRMLTKRLRELEDVGIVSRRRYREVPPRVEYALTEAGQALRPIIQAMEEWGSRWVEQGPAPPMAGEIPASPVPSSSSTPSSSIIDHG